MSSSNISTSIANVDAIHALNYSKLLFAQVWSFILFCFGTVGHTLSIYVFTRRSLCSNACSRYFLASAMTGLGVVYINIPLRLLQVAYHIDVFASSESTCKILTWSLNWMKVMPSWIIVLACADRFLCSSASITTRSWSSIRVVIPATSLTILIVGLAYVHVTIYVRVNTASLCALPPSAYTTFYGIFNLIIFNIGPPIGMFTFGLLTMQNVRRRVKRIVPFNTDIRTQAQNGSQHRQKATDRQLMQMMIVQCTFFILTTTPSSVYFCYSRAISNVVADALQTARLGLASSIVNFLGLTGPCMSFYVFTLSSQLFRRELMHLFKCQRQKMPLTAVRTINQRQKNRPVLLLQLNR